MERLNEDGGASTASGCFCKLGEPPFESVLGLACASRAACLSVFVRQRRAPLEFESSTANARTGTVAPLPEVVKESSFEIGSRVTHLPPAALHPKGITPADQHP
ncbi:hypothetical protein ISCGN_017568 [Ixodes scapularis]